MLQVPQNMKDSVVSSTLFWKRAQRQATSGLEPHRFLPLHDKTENPSMDVFWGGGGVVFSFASSFVLGLLFLHFVLGFFPPKV